MSDQPELGRTESDRAEGALLGTFVGDALGMPFEGSSPSMVPKRVEMQDARLGRGTYTDDTQMMIALAESLLERGRIDPGHLAQAFVSAYDPRRGYGSGTREVLRLIREGAPPSTAATAAFDGQGSLGNGAAMRVAPVAVRFAGEADRLLAEAEESARVTHAHPLGIDAARVQVVAIAAALRGADPLSAARAAAKSDKVRRQLEAVAALIAGSPTPHQVAATLGNSSAGHESVPTAIYAATGQGSFEGAVSFAVRCGGDADTIAAMAGAISGAREGASAIPRRWLDALENGKKGRSHVLKLADRLVGG